MPNPISATFGLLPWLQGEAEATNKAEVTDRGQFVPLSTYDDGKEHFSWPGAFQDVAEFPHRFGKAYDEAKTTGDSHNLGREVGMAGLSTLGMGTLFGAVPKGAFAANSIRREAPDAFDDLPFDLPDASPGASSGANPFDTFAPAAPAIKRNDGEIFDYARHDDLPAGNPLNLPKQDYYKSPREPKPDSDAARIMELAGSRKVQNTINKAVERGVSGENRNATLNWYNTEPLRERFHDLYKGEGSPDDAYLKLMQAVGTTSPQNQVLPNAAEATQIYQRLMRGQDIPRDGDGLSGVAAKGKAVLSRKKFGLEPGYNPKDAQKTEFFGRSLAGDDSKVVVDSHAMRGLAMPTKDPRYLGGSVRYKADHGGYENFNPREMVASGEMSMADALKSPTYWLSAPTDATYRYAAKPYERAAEKFGLSPGQAQAAAWYGNSDLTGVATMPKTFNELFEMRLRTNAQNLNMDPEELLRRVINGEEHLLGSAPLPMSPGGEDE